MTTLKSFNMLNNTTLGMNALKKKITFVCKSSKYFPIQWPDLHDIAEAGALYMSVNTRATEK